MTREAHRPASFGAWLEHQLDRREWNQSDLARRVGVRPAVVSRWVRNERVPNTASCVAIADALDRDPDEVLMRAGHRPNISHGDLDDMYARLDPYLREALGRPNLEDAIVDIVASVVSSARMITPPDDPEPIPAETRSRTGQAR